MLLSSSVFMQIENRNWTKAIWPWKKMIHKRLIHRSCSADCKKIFFFLSKNTKIFSEVYFKVRDDLKPLAVRDLKAHFIGKLVALKGIVIRATEVKPMASVITYICDTCGSETFQPVYQNFKINLN
jgi:DNA replicative helicase MCM subunit Mcm2 (Cdc46/Mcm family)